MLLSLRQPDRRQECGVFCLFFVSLVLGFVCVSGRNGETGERPKKNPEMDITLELKAMFSLIQCLKYL